MSRKEVEKLAVRTLKKIFRENKDKGLLSIYLWGSTITPDFDPASSDVDAIGILSDEANFDELDRIREWLPKAEPKLKRLQINFLYLSELRGGATKSRLARLHDAEQAVFDFPYWLFVTGKKFQLSDLPVVTPEQALKHQVALAEAKMSWVLSGKYGDMGLRYFCKGLAWLCYDIHKLSVTPGPFSWKGLEDEATDETKQLVHELLILKSKNWELDAIRAKLPQLQEQAKKLIIKYRA